MNLSSQPDPKPGPCRWSVEHNWGSEALNLFFSTFPLIGHVSVLVLFSAWAQRREQLGAVLSDTFYLVQMLVLLKYNLLALYHLDSFSLIGILKATHLFINSVILFSVIC